MFFLSTTTVWPQKRFVQFLLVLSRHQNFECYCNLLQRDTIMMNANNQTCS